MRIMATDFASSPSGWVITTLVLIILGLVSFIAVRLFDRQDKQEENTSELSTSVTQLTEQVRTLALSVADLKTEINSMRRERIIRGK